MKEFLRQIAQKFYSEYGKKNDLADFLFVFPNRRPGLSFKKYLSELAQKPIFSPQVLTINEFFQQFSSLKQEDNIALLFRLFEVFKEVVNPFEDYDGSFTAARLGTLGIIINTDKVKTAPTQWSDLMKPEFKNGFAVANPALSGTAYMSIALLNKQFGPDFFVDLKANGARVGKGSGQVIDDTASGELTACLGVDYITNAKIAKGAHLKMCYPPELLMVPSPVAIFKDTKQLDVAQKVVDYLLGKEAQQMVANQGTIPVREDVKIDPKFGLVSPKVAIEKGIKVNYHDIIDSKEKIVKEFTELMQVKK